MADIQTAPSNAAPVDSGPTIPLTEGEIAFLDTISEEFPALFKHVSENAQFSEGFDIECTKFKGRNPKRDVFDFIFYADYLLSKGKSVTDTAATLTNYTQSPTPLNQLDWGNDVLLIERRIAETSEMLDACRKAELKYNSRKRRAIRSKYRSKASNPEADQCMVPCPETGEQVKAEILGRHPHRKKYLALALPSNNPEHPTIGRGHYIDGALDSYSAIYKTYCSQGSNHTLSIATDKEMLEECSPNEYEQNVVFTMPWGKTWRYASYGVPHGREDRDFVLFPKAVLASAWGMAVAVDVMTGQMQQAGQPVKGKVASDKVKAKSWGM
jgi:hypothetical protein